MNPPPDAVIFVPGLGEAPSIDQSADGIARRIANALDRSAQTSQVKFEVQPEGREESFGDNLTTRVRTVVRKAADQAAPVIDLYKLDYAALLTKRYQGGSFFAKVMQVAAALGSNVFEILRSIRQGSAKRWREQVQVFYVLLILLLLVVYMGLLVAAVAETLRATPQLFAAQPPQQQSLPWLQTAVVFLTTLGVLTPNWRAAITRAAEGYVCVIYYLKIGERRDVLVGQLTSLLEHIAEKPAGSYGRIHLLAYSFGTLLVLDALFPRGRKPQTRFAQVDQLVTIGCPFDLVYTYLPSYFRDRKAPGGAPRRWINVFSTVDVLSSDFTNTAGQPIGLGVDPPAAGRPTENVRYTGGLELDRLTWPSIFLLAGLRSHSMYWETPYENEISCFDQVIPAMYQGEALLG